MTPYYDHGGITIYHGDCTRILLELQPAHVNLVLTDPPYGIGLSNHDPNGRRSDWREIIGDVDRTAGLWLLAWAADLELPLIVFASPWNPWPGDWRNLIVWDKGGAVGGGADTKTCLKRSWELIQVCRNGAMIGPRQESVWHFRMLPGDSAEHIAAKPTGLITTLLRQFGGDVILDPFMGSGSTAVACKRMCKQFLGIEIEERYCEIAAKRLSQEVFSF